MKISIFVVTHKPFNEVKNSLYKTLQVGFKIKENRFSQITDSTGDNISEKNSSYCELTAFYWIWKNVNDLDYVGVCHYRRYFTNSVLLNSSKLFVNRYQIKRIMNKYDVILPKPLNLKMSVRDFYSYCDGVDKDLETTREVIKEKFPDYLNDFDGITKSFSSSYCNMLITSKQLFDQYCSWLFEILFSVESKTDMSGYTPTQSRVYGYISEILLNVWVSHNKLKVKYLDVINTESSFMYRLRKFF